jgi:uncharacterized protein YaaQ
MCIIVVPEGDGDRLIAALREGQFGATRLVSKGGLRGRGSATILSGVSSARVSDVSRILHEQFPVANEAIPAHTFPWWEEGEGPDDAVEIRLGGAVMFVVRASRFDVL